MRRLLNRIFVGGLNPETASYYKGRADVEQEQELQSLRLENRRLRRALKVLLNGDDGRNFEAVDVSEYQ